MTHSVVNVGEPANTLHADILTTIRICSATGRLKRIRIRDMEFSVAGMNGISKPHLIIFDKRERFFVCNGINVPDYGKLFSAVRDPLEKWPEKRKGRIGDDKVRFIPQLRHLFRPEVAVSFKVAGKLNVILVNAS